MSLSPQVITDDDDEIVAVRIVLSGPGGIDRQTIRSRQDELSADIIEALKAWTLGPGDTIKIVEV